MPEWNVLLAVLCEGVFRELFRKGLVRETHDLWRDVAMQVLMDSGI
jgi:hypothetical protein